MYSMVLMMAVAGSGDAASFGGLKKGCHGCTSEVVVAAAPAGCSGSSSCHGGFLGGMRAKHSCHGGTSCTGCNGGGLFHRNSCHGGFLGGMKAKHSCHGAQVECCPAPVVTACGGCEVAPAVVMPAAPAAAPAKEMPKPEPAKEAPKTEKKSS